MHTRTLGEHGDEVGPVLLADDRLSGLERRRPTGVEHEAPVVVGEEGEEASVRPVVAAHRGEGTGSRCASGDADAPLDAAHDAIRRRRVPSDPPAQGWSATGGNHVGRTRCTAQVRVAGTHEASSLLQHRAGARLTPGRGTAQHPRRRDARRMALLRLRGGRRSAGLRSAGPTAGEAHGPQAGTRRMVSTRGPGRRGRPHRAGGGPLGAWTEAPRGATRSGAEVLPVAARRGAPLALVLRAERRRCRTGRRPASSSAGRRSGRSSCPGRA